MPYRFAQEREDYTDFAPGVVLSGVPGRPVFPVRLTDEIFQRCRAHLVPLNVHPPYTIYDPCCGSGYLLSTLAYLHWFAVQQVIGSDIDPEALSLAHRNLTLLTHTGLDRRMVELRKLYNQFGKPSHADALQRTARVRAQVGANEAVHRVTTRTFRTNALDPTALATHLAAVPIDMVISDIPYGIQSTWMELPTQAASQPAGWHLLEALRAIVSPRTIIAITSNKQPRIVHDAYHRVEQLHIGKRRTLFYRLLQPSNPGADDTPESHVKHAPHNKSFQATPPTPVKLVQVAGAVLHE